MAFYVRAYVFGGSYSFTVALLERCRRLLTENVEGYMKPSVWCAINGRSTSMASSSCPITWNMQSGIKGTMTRISTTVFNPVKHGWVPRVADWPHSSFHRFVRLGLAPLE
jgi:hypothetical protein